MCIRDSFETVDEATSQIEMATRQYDRAISPVDEGNVAVRILAELHGSAPARVRACIEGPRPCPQQAKREPARAVPPGAAPAYSHR